MSEALKEIVDGAGSARAEDSAQLLISNMLILAISAMSVSDPGAGADNISEGLKSTTELFALWRECVIYNYQLEVE